MRNIVLSIGHLPRQLAVGIIALYQATLSPDHGPLKNLHPYGFCRHEPTCSQYAKIQIAQKGLMMGGMRSVGRILRCNPFVKPSDEKLKKLIARASQ